MALRIVALFAVYTGVAFVGDYAIGLIAREAPPASAEGVQPSIDDRAVVVEVRPEIVTRVQVRRTDRCDYALDREVTLSASGVSLVEVQAGSGSLHVEGQDGLEEVVVVGRVCASEEEFLDELTVSGEVADGTVSIRTHYPDQRSWSGSRTAQIDLVVLVPTGMAVDIEDSSGEMAVMRTGALRIDDSSGGISLSDIRGSLDVDDSSGGLEIDGVEGDVRIEDGSGGIDVRNVRGSVALRDGSGGIDVVGIDGDVVVEGDGSGSIAVRDVGRDFIVRRDGSGGIRYSDVRGTIDIPSDKRRGR